MANPKITVETTYKGEKINQDFLDKNPEIASLMPNKSLFNLTYTTIMAKAEQTGKHYKISLSEQGIKTSEI